MYAKPIILSELATSDHNMFFIKPNNESIIGTGSIVRVTIRCMNSDNKARFAEMLRAVKWETMFRMKSCNEQYIFYETVINHCFPNKTVTRHSGDKPWVTDWFRSLVRKRQRAHSYAR